MLPDILVSFALLASSAFAAFAIILLCGLLYPDMALHDAALMVVSAVVYQPVCEVIIATVACKLDAILAVICLMAGIDALFNQVPDATGLVRGRRIVKRRHFLGTIPYMGSNGRTEVWARG